MKKKTSKLSSVTIRQCSNIKSKKHPDVRCPYTASDGEFCSRHSKRPTKFQEKTSLVTTVSTKAHTTAAKSIQTMWRKRICYVRRKRQGPSSQFPEISENSTDICTMESVTTIPFLYRWSYADSKKHCWIFDIRSLSMMRIQDSGTILLNPYTREEISGKAYENFQKRCQQLRNHKYCLLHTNDIDLTEEQLWHQKVLDITMKYDTLGYHISLDWFNELSALQCYVFYYELWELWIYRLHLTTAIKNLVVPSWNEEATLLFKWLPVEIRNKRDRKWWQKNILDILEKLVSGKEKDHRTLGALYGMTAFAITSPSVRDSYPWLVEMS